MASHVSTSWAVLLVHVPATAERHGRAEGGMEREGAWSGDASARIP